MNLIGHRTNPVGDLVFEFVTTFDRQHNLTYFSRINSNVYKNVKFPQKNAPYGAMSQLMMKSPKTSKRVFKNLQIDVFFIAETQNLLEMCSKRCP